MGVPVFIGGQGVENIIKIDFNQDEKIMFKKSVKAVSELIVAMKKTSIKHV